MNKRKFLATLGLGGLGLAMRNLPRGSPALANGSPPRKHWVWLATESKGSAGEWKGRFALMREAGISAILPEVYNSRQAHYESGNSPAGDRWLEEILPIASGEGLEIHAWMWAMPCNIEAIRREHPEWFMVNRKGESAAEKPAYVDYYRFLCPSHPEVHEFVKRIFSELCAIRALAGVHLDYIRYPDVILAEGIQPRYGLKQDREFPEFDYCYCDLCRRDFKEESGTDPMAIPDPAGHAEWRQFRYDRITRLVNETLIPVARAQKKIVTAAVFPNWENVRQQWSAWDVDGLMPMLYHTFYTKGPEWVGEETEKGVKSLKGRVPLYSGIFVPQLSQDEFGAALEAALAGGAGGIALFHGSAMSKLHWETFRRVMR